MNAPFARSRLYLITGATLVFLGGLLVAIGHWNRAEIDRAFVEAAEQAARAPQPANSLRFWAPANQASPDSATRVRLEAAERLRQIPALPRIAPSTPEKTPVTPR